MERYIRNPHGITIRCCCATCQHKTLDRGDDGCGRVQSPAYIRWKCQNYAEILKRHDGNETFSRFWSRVHELYERQTGLSVYVRI